ncbi:MAG TPA: GNAT family N-acetyltransferase [Acidimicrobiales bacterium]|nr:GNAT family N-acetyltransferase [Acidimicrobiales bacterium]
MIEIRPMRTEDAPQVTGLLAQLGYPSELDSVKVRLKGILGAAGRRMLVAVPADESRVDGYVGVERRLALEEDEHVEITGLVVDSAARQSGVGRALVMAAERWAVSQGIHVVVVRSNVVRLESHPFYESIGYQRTKTSHIYRKEL